MEPVTGDEPEGTVGEVAGKLPLELIGTDGADIDCDEVVSVTGQTVVLMGIVEVITWVESAGQLVTVGAQLVIVISLVEYTVEVVHCETLADVIDPVTGDEPDRLAGELTGDETEGPAGEETEEPAEDDLGKLPLGLTGVDGTGVDSV